MIARISLLLIAFVLLGGCRHGKRTSPRLEYSPSSLSCDSPTRLAADCDFTEHCDEPFLSAAPRTSVTELPGEFWMMSLEEAIQIALSDAEILRSLNANVLQSQNVVPTAFDPAIVATDVLGGVEAALSEFDANLSSSLIYSNNDDVFNNPVLSGGAAEVQQDLTVGRFNLSKIAATGTRFDIQSSVQHDNNNNPSVLFPHSWTSLWQATVRQPLLQGRGVDFNRIAGPNAQLGLRNPNGIVIAQLNHDIAVLQFERDIRSYVNEIVNSYWQLELAYKNFETIKATRDGSLKSWNIVKARRENGLPGGEADRELQAREQYYQFQSQLLAALNGDQLNGTAGVLQAESNLRRLINLPQSDERVIRPLDEPVVVETVLNWNDIAIHAVYERAEIREQVRTVRRRELEKFAAKNFIMPRLDAIATFRNNGFGDDLINGGAARFSGAIDDAISGYHNEWEVGFTVDMPIGFRQAYSNVKNAELQLQRERAILREQKNQLMHELGAAVRQYDQSFANIELAQLRKEAASETVKSRFAAYEADAIGFDELLDAQSRELSAQLNFDRAVTNFELARNGLYLQSGRLLDEHGISVCESCRH